MGQAAVLAAVARDLRPAVPVVGIAAGVLPVLALARAVLAARRTRRSPSAAP